MSLTGKPLVALLSAQVQDPSVIEGWMMLVVTSSVGYTCGEQCGVVGVYYENKSPLLCLGGMWRGGAVCGGFRGKPCGIWDLPNSSAHDALCTICLGLSVLPQHPHPCLLTPLCPWQFSEVNSLGRSLVRCSVK